MKKTEKLRVFFRIILGVVFVSASIPKILNPSDFAAILYGYSLFPLSLINILAIVFPFIEFVTGFFLIFGIYPKSALIIFNFLISFFIIIISYNLLRDHEFDCGCFAVGDPSHVTAAGQLLVRNFVLLIIGLCLFFDNLSFSQNSKS